MQNNNSKLNTSLLVILIILAGILVWHSFSQDRQQAYTPTPMPQVNQVSQDQNSQSNTQNTVADSDFKLYQGPGFSFLYYKDTQVKMYTDTFGTQYGVSVNGGDFADSIRFFPNGLPSNYFSASFLQDCHNVVYNSKTFSECPTESGGTVDYIYTQNGKSVVLSIQSRPNKPKPNGSYIYLGSIEIQ